MPGGGYDNIGRDGTEEICGAGGGIRTLNPVRGLVFETSAYTIPPRRPVEHVV